MGLPRIEGGKYLFTEISPDILGNVEYRVPVPPHTADRPLQDASNEVQEPPEIPLMDGWTMPKSKQPQLILTEVASIDPGVAALLAMISILL
jgi:hypothetical protein